MTREELEGRLSAHRDALTLLFSLLAEDARTETRTFLFDWLDERSRMKDHQEDPGAVDQTGMVEQNGRAREFRLISEDVRALVDLGRNQSP